MSMRDNQSTTSVNTLSFNEDFEAQVNSNMNPRRVSRSEDSKAPMPPTSPSPFEANDKEYNEKMAMKDQHQLPPRFSTIFDTKGPTVTPTRAFESYPQQPARKSGVYLPKPVFWALFAIFLFESAALFAYTVIGLVNNMPSKLIHTNSAGAVVAGCDCNSQPINISPNFFMPQAPQAPVVETTTASTSANASSTSSPSSSSSQTINPGVSELASLIKSAASATSTSESSTHTPTTTVVTVTPSGSTVRSTTILTVDPSGSTLPPRPTVTSIQWVTPTSKLETRDEPTSIVSTTSVPENTPSVVPFDTPILLTLKSHRQLANKPTQEAEVAASSATLPASSESSETVSITSHELIPRVIPTSTKVSNGGIVVNGELPDMGWHGLEADYEQN